MLLLFWSGIQDGIGAGAAQGAVSGSGYAQVSGQGAVVAVAVLIGVGFAFVPGIGVITSVAILTGDGAGIVPAIDYYWFVTSPGGVSYAIPSADALDISYNDGDDPASVAYHHQPPVRRLP